MTNVLLYIAIAAGLAAQPAQSPLNDLQSAYIADLRAAGDDEAAQQTVYERRLADFLSLASDPSTPADDALEALWTATSIANTTQDWTLSESLASQGLAAAPTDADALVWGNQLTAVRLELAREDPTLLPSALEAAEEAIAAAARLDDARLAETDRALAERAAWVHWKRAEILERLDRSAEAAEAWRALADFTRRLPPAKAAALGAGYTDQALRLAARGALDAEDVDLALRLLRDIRTLPGRRFEPSFHVRALSVGFDAMDEPHEREFFGRWLREEQAWTSYEVQVAAKLARELAAFSGPEKAAEAAALTDMILAQPELLAEADLRGAESMLKARRSQGHQLPGVESLGAYDRRLTTHDMLDARMRALRELGEAAGARAAGERLRDEFPDSPRAAAIHRDLAELTAAPDGGTP